MTSSKKQRRPRRKFTAEFKADVVRLEAQSVSRARTPAPGRRGGDQQPIAQLSIAHAESGAVLDQRLQHTDALLNVFGLHGLGGGHAHAARAARAPSTRSAGGHGRPELSRGPSLRVPTKDSPSGFVVLVLDAVRRPRIRCQSYVRCSHSNRARARLLRAGLPGRLRTDEHRERYSAGGLGG